MCSSPTQNVVFSQHDILAAIGRLHVFARVLEVQDAVPGLDLQREMGSPGSAGA